MSEKTDETEHEAPVDDAPAPTEEETSEDAAEVAESAPGEDAEEHGPRAEVDGDDEPEGEEDAGPDAAQEETSEVDESEDEATPIAASTEGEPSDEEPEEEPERAVVKVEPAKPDPRVAVEENVRAIEVTLRKTWRAYQTPAIVEGALWWATSVCAVVLSALLVAAIAPTAIPEVVRWMLTIGLGATTIGALTALVVAKTRQPDEVTIARLVQRHAPSLRNDLASALVFGRQILSKSFEEGSSESLARIHIKRARKGALDAAQDGHLAHLLPARTIGPAAIALAGCASLLLTTWIAAPAWFTNTLAGRSTEAGVAMDAAPTTLPLIGNLSVTLIYPSYTGLKSRHEPFTTGNVTALEGTELVVQAYGLLQGVATMELVFTGATGERPIVMTQESGGRLEAKMVLTESGSYTFRATMPDGRVYTDGIDRVVQVTPDEAPGVALLSHSGEVEVSPEDVLTLRVSASDDYGITSITRIHAFSGTEDDSVRVGVQAPELDSGPREWSGEVTLDLRELGLQPKDVVTIVIEARDTNTLTGPGVGESSPLILRVSSPEDKHYKNIAAQQQIAEMLLDSLADVLEAPVGRRQPRKDDSYLQLVDTSWNQEEMQKRHNAYYQAHERLRDVLAKMGEVAKTLDGDPLMVARDVTMFSTFHTLLSDLHTKGEGVLRQTKPLALKNKLDAARLQRLATHAAAMEAALEKAIVQLDELLQSQKMESIKSTTDEIRALKERLRDLLQKYKETKDPELKKAIRREIERLRQRMNELMQRMNDQLRQMPQDHVNMDAARQQMLESDAEKMRTSFDDIEKMLENDDIDGALEALDKMTEGLDSLTQEMNEQFDGMQPEGLQEFDKKVSELMDEVNDLSQLQQEIEQDTAELKEELKAKRERETERMLDGFNQQMKRQIDAQRKALDAIDPNGLDTHHRANLERAKESLKELEENIEDKDIEGALEKARETLDEVEQMRMSMQISQRYVPRKSSKGKSLEKALDTSEPVMDRGAEMVEDLQGLIERAQRMREGQGDPRLDKLAERQREANERGEQLKKKIGDAGEEFPVLKEQLEPTMDEAGEAMQDAQQGLEGERVQRALDSEREALEKLRSMKQKMQQALQKQRKKEQEGQGSNSKEAVPIPEKSEAKGPGFRDAIKKTMKEDRLDDYSLDIEDYYKSLVD